MPYSFRFAPGTTIINRVTRDAAKIVSHCDADGTAPQYEIRLLTSQQLLRIEAAALEEHNERL